MHHTTYIHVSTVVARVYVEAGIDAACRFGLVRSLGLVPHRELTVVRQLQPVIEHEILWMEHCDPPLERRLLAVGALEFCEMVPHHVERSLLGRSPGFQHLLVKTPPARRVARRLSDEQSVGPGASLGGWQCETVRQAGC